MEILVGRASAIQVDGRACAAIRDSVRGPLRSFADLVNYVKWRIKN